VGELDYGVGGPKLIADFFARDHLARTLQQHPEYLKGLILKPDPDAVFAQLGCSEIELKWTETDIRGWAPALGLGTPLHLRIFLTASEAKYITPPCDKGQLELL
jgi:hypothetical protein